MKKTIWLFIIQFLIISCVKTFAHEPIYGRGPHVLYKGGFAPSIVWNSGAGFIQNDFELGYGVTSSWTAGFSLPFSNANGRYEIQNYLIKCKYRFYADFEPGSMTQISALGGYKFSKESDGINALNLGLTGGRESTTWYWFASAAYTAKFTNSELKPGNEINYDLTLGYRFTRLDYYKPDLVIFLEFLGKYYQKSQLNDNTINNSGGNAWSIAPTFMLTYRNYALRSGVEFGLADNGFINKPKTNFKIGVEVHF